MNKGIIFDLDDILWDSSEEVAASWNEVLQKQQDVKKLLQYQIRRVLWGRLYQESPGFYLAIQENKEVWSLCRSAVCFYLNKVL